MRLHLRFVLPQALLGILGITAVAWVAQSVTTQALRTEARRTIVDAARVLSRGGLALNPAIVAAVRDLTEADVVTFDRHGLIASSLDKDLQAALIEAVIARASAASVGEEPVELSLIEEGHPYLAVYAEVTGIPDTGVVLLLDEAPSRLATAELRRRIGGAALLTLVLMLLAGELAARRVTGPIGQLVRVADTVAGPGATTRAPEGVDEVGRLGAAFNQMLARLTTAQAAVVNAEKRALAGEFAARVAHDVRNPLSSMKMQCQMLRDRAASSDEASIADSLLADIDQVEFVVSNLLGLARPSQLRPEPTDLNQLIAGVLQLVEPQVTHRRLRVTRTFDSSIGLMPIDREQMRLALRNVIVNAIEAMRAEGTLTLSTGLTDSGDAAVITVVDDGVGIERERLGRIFDPFQTTKPDGVGLGLVNTKGTVEAHGGSIRVAPATPRGTMVTMILPLRSGEGHAHG